MKALTVQQPWAWAIFHGKDVENRSWTTPHRGRLLIHAGGRWSDAGGCSNLVVRHPDYADAEMTKAAILGVVDLVGTHVAFDGCCDSPWAEQAYVEQPTAKTRRDVHHWELMAPTLLEEPIACPGRLQLWTPGNDVLDQVREQVGAWDL